MLSKTKLKDFTVSLIYGACKLGFGIDVSDLAIHTLIAVSEYAASIIESKGKNLDNSEPVSLSSIGEL